MRSYVSLDFETTGFSPVSNEIIEIGAWKVVDGVVVEKFSELVKPVGYISKDVQRITGITSDMLVDKRSIEEIIPEFYDFVGDLPFLGHNIDFDFSFIYRKGKNSGYDFSMGGERLGIDTLALSRKYFPEVRHTLSDMANLFKISITGDKGGFHRATYDAYITKLVYDRFLYLYSDKPMVQTPYKLLRSKEVYGRAVNNGTLAFE